MDVVRVTGTNLPEGATHGFKIVEDGKTLMFFHWNEEATFEVPVVERIVGEEITMGTTEHRRTSYADVLAAMPDRFKAMGLEKETDAIMGEIVGMFGAGS